MDSIKKVFVLGGTGPSGKETLIKCLDKGYSCYSMSRSETPVKLPERIQKEVTWKKGDVLDVESLITNLKGCDAVISCIGTNGKLGKTTIYSKGIKNIIQAMEINNIGKLIFITSAHDIPYTGCCYRNFVKKFILNRIYEDMIIAEEFLRGYKGPVQWICLRPFEFIYKPSQGKSRAVEKQEITSAKGWSWKTMVEDIGIFNSNEIFSTKYENKFICFGQ